MLAIHLERAPGVLVAEAAAADGSETSSMVLPHWHTALPEEEVEAEARLMWQVRLLQRDVRLDRAGSGEDEAAPIEANSESVLTWPRSNLFLGEVAGVEEVVEGAAQSSTGATVISRPKEVWISLEAMVAILPPRCASSCSVSSEVNAEETSLRLATRAWSRTLAESDSEETACAGATRLYAPGSGCCCCCSC